MNHFKMKYSFSILHLKKQKKKKKEEEDNLDMPTNIRLNSKLILKTHVMKMTYSMFLMW